MDEINPSASATVKVAVNKWRDLEYWTKRVNAEGWKVAKATGNAGSFIIISAFNWRRFSAAVLNSGHLSFTDPEYFGRRTGIWFFGYQVAVLAGENDILEVR